MKLFSGCERKERQSSLNTLFVQLPIRCGAQPPSTPVCGVILRWLTTRRGSSYPPQGDPGKNHIPPPNSNLFPHLQKKRVHLDDLWNTFLFLNLIFVPTIAQWYKWIFKTYSLHCCVSSRHAAPRFSPLSLSLSLSLYIYIYIYTHTHTYTYTSDSFSLSCC